METVGYAAKLRDEKELYLSTSGGCFTAISDIFLDREDAIVCSSYDFEHNRMAFHLITNRAERDLARGSKYIQSELHDIFRTAKRWLADNPEKRLLFVGVGCQSAAFRKYAQFHQLDNRVTVIDLICHGVESPLIWGEYIRYISKGEKLSEVSFRDKRDGWSKPFAFVKVDKKEIDITGYLRILYANIMLRPSCYQCPYASVFRDTDLTIGDFWGVEKTYPELFDEKGLSVILAHTEKGVQLVEDCKKTMSIREVTIKSVIQPNLIGPTKKPHNRSEFWRDYKNNDFRKIMIKYAREGSIRKILRKVKALLP